MKYEFIEDFCPTYLLNSLIPSEEEKISFVKTLLKEKISFDKPMVMTDWFHNYFTKFTCFTNWLLERGYIKEKEIEIRRGTFEVTTIKEHANSKTILMRDMQPGDIGLIVSGIYTGKYAMRAPSRYIKQIFLLDRQESWSDYRGYAEVSLLSKDAEITLKLK